MAEGSSADESASESILEVSVEFLFAEEGICLGNSAEGRSAEGAERTGSELVPLVSELRLKFPSAGAVTEVLEVSSAGTEEGSDRLSVEVSLAGAGPEVVVSVAAPEICCTAGAGLEVPGLLETMPGFMSSAEGRFFGADNLFRERSRIESQ